MLGMVNILIKVRYYMLEFGNLDKESQIIFLLLLSEIVLNKLEKSDEKEILENAIKMIW